MSTHTHIQRTGPCRSAVVAAVVVALLAVAPAGLAAGTKQGGKSPTLRIHPMPAGGCGSSCKRY
jgi:hypothetical protein